MVEEPRSSPPVQHQNIVDAAFDDTANDILDFSKESNALVGEASSPTVVKEGLWRTDASLSKNKETPVKLKESKIPTLADRRVSESPAKLNNTKELDLIMQKAEKLRESMGQSLGASKNFLQNFSGTDEALKGMLFV
jgi:hypothetical protein